MRVRHLQTGREGQLKDTRLLHHQGLEQTRVQLAKRLAPYNAVAVPSTLNQARVDAADIVVGRRVDERGKREQFVWPHLVCRMSVVSLFSACSDRVVSFLCFIYLECADHFAVKEIRNAGATNKEQSTQGRARRQTQENARATARSHHPCGLNVDQVEDSVCPLSFKVDARHARIPFHDLPGRPPRLRL